MTKRSKRVLDPDYLRIGGLIRGGTTLYASAIKWIDPDPGHDERAGEPLAVATRESSATCSFAKNHRLNLASRSGRRYSREFVMCRWQSLIEDYTGVHRR